MGNIQERISSGNMPISPQPFGDFKPPKGFSPIARAD